MFVLFTLINQHAVAAINSATITQATLKALPHCLHYQVRGMCYWLDGNGINTTPYVEHYLPDLIVSVFNKPGDNPWFEINNTLDKGDQVAERQLVSSITGLKVGYGQHSFSDIHEQNVYFKEADVIGNPGLTVLPNIGLLPSTATPYISYYQSMLDSASWRGLPQIKTTLAEEAYAMVADINHHVGGIPINWGGIYPHEGKVGSSNDAKAAAVIAQRAGDLITSSNLIILGHIYQPLSNHCGQQCNASPVQENSQQTQFQMIYPKEEVSCDYFGKTPMYGNSFEQQAKGAYVWIVWRFYKGCADGSGKFIGKTIH